MLKKTIEYVDFDGTTRKEDFYFNLTQSEIAAMELSTKGGLVEKINRIVAEQDGEQIINFFRDFILKSYGEKSPDGKHFQKSEELSKKFSWTMAYDQLFMELCTNADRAAAFVNAVVPATVAEEKN
jgi:hypothetical protein